MRVLRRKMKRFQGQSIVISPIGGGLRQESDVGVPKEKALLILIAV